MDDRDSHGRFAPGSRGNPLGRPKLPAELKAITRLSPAILKTIIARISLMTHTQLKMHIETGNFTMIENTIASIIEKAMMDGDHSRLNFLLDRAIGKVVEERRIQIQPVTYKTTVLPDGGLIQELMREEFGEELDHDHETIDVVAK